MLKMTDNAKTIADEIRDSLELYDRNKRKAADAVAPDRVYVCTYKLSRVLDMDPKTVDGILKGLPRYPAGKRSLRYRISDVAIRLDKIKILS